MDDWFTLERIDEDTDILSEYRHWEETHCYLLRGRERSLLIDTGLGICDIRQAVDRLTDRPVAAVATHIHWDHIGGHRYFPEFYAHEAELNWLSGGFPLSVEAVRAMVADRCCLPEDFDVSRYTLFQGHPARVLRDGDRIELGGRTLEVRHTPGHSPGHMCFWEAERGYLFSGDLVYRGTLFACYPSTDPGGIPEFPGADRLPADGAPAPCPPRPGHRAGAPGPCAGRFPRAERAGKAPPRRRHL